MTNTTPNMKNTCVTTITPLAAKLCRSDLQRSRPFLSPTITTLATWCCAMLVGFTAAPADDIDFTTDIRPILSNNCFACHGPDEETQEAGLRLDDEKIATTELESGTVAVVPGKPDASELIARITTDDEDLRMPPADFGKKLSTTDIEKLRAWIQQGAPYSAHWSYIKPTRPNPPKPDNEHKKWPRNEVDNFILHRMQQHNLAPSPEADRYALARRVFLDLTGLPPTIEEVDAFVADNDPQAYEKLVDDLLQRPSFGEHWARKWLDLARYADSAGYADDPPRTIWAYRDWVIRSINDNMPFDQFTIEQLAGDLLPDPGESQLIATAFHRNTLTNNEGGTQDEEFRNVAVVDRVNTTMAVWMGTTMACAQCHTHKYDPISQDEYFQFFAILNNTQDADRRNESPIIEIFTDDQKNRKLELQSQIEQLTSLINTSTPELLESQSKWESRLHSKPAWTKLAPQSVTRSSKGTVKLLDDGGVLIEDSAETDTFVVDLPINPKSDAAQQLVSAIRLQTLPHESLPGQGSGHGGGNFVITSVKAQVVPADNSSPQAKFIRITNNGKGQILSLAEVQVFSGTENIAPKGKATQHSTGFSGPPELAIDGNTDGNYDNKSVTHTNTVDDPWWELDLNHPSAIDRIVIWNRTDNNLHTRLTNFTVELLDADRQSVVRQVFKDSPNPSADYSPSNIRDITFRSAFADYNQPNFEPTDVLTGKTGNNDGWAVGGSTTQPHQLILVPNAVTSIDRGATLRIHIDHKSPHKNHLLGQFQISTTDDQTTIERSRLPQNILATLDTPADQRSAERSEQLATYYRSNVAPELSQQRTALSNANQQLAEMKPATSVPVLREITDKPRETRLQFRGNYLDKGQVVSPGVPSAFHPLPKDTIADRKGLAEWLVDENNPLTARVLANRYWEIIFGRGIVVTSEEFGSQGELPTHPQLLDWLATEVIANGWDRKALLRMLVTSATYRQATRVTPKSIAADPDNRWLSRGPRVRHSAEMIRDQALLAAGLLSDRMYGPPVKPPQPSMGLSAAFGSSTDWKTSEGEDRYRRGIYTTWRRSNPYPSMATFDAPNREVCTVRRNRTNTPLQSLVTLNDPVYVEAAQSLARIALQHSDNLNEQITHAFRRCVLRPPTANEVETLAALFNDSKASLIDKPTEAMNLATDPLGPLPDGMKPADAAAMTVVCNVLLNLDEMFLKR